MMIQVNSNKYKINYAKSNRKDNKKELREVNQAKVELLLNPRTSPHINQLINLNLIEAKVEPLTIKEN